MLKLRKRPRLRGFGAIYQSQLSEKYWWKRTRRHKVIFRLKKANFVLASLRRSARENASAVSEILKSILLQIAFAFFLVYGLEIADHYLLPFYGRIPIPGDLVPHLNDEIYHSLLIAIASMAGVFLALFFTTVSVVASTSYAVGPGDLRDLLLKDKYGRIYIRLLTLTLAVSVILLVHAAMGFSLSALNLLLVVVLAIFSVFSFVPLGMRALYFFDPASLTEHVMPRLSQTIRAVTPDGFAWLDPSFQAHHQKTGGNHLTQYQNIVDVASTRERSKGESYAALAITALGLLKHYSNEKHRIPSESHWFRRILQHRDWLTADDAYTRTALATSTSIQPDSVPDILWFEKRIELILQTTMRTQLKWKDMEGALLTVQSLQNTLGSLSSRYSVHEAVHIFRALRPEIHQHIASAAGLADHKHAPDGDSGLLLALALLDSYLAAPIEMLIAYSARLEQVTPESFREIITSIRWRKPKTLYAHALPRSVLRELEDLQSRIDFETRVEGREVTPSWYKQQIAALGFVRSIKSDIETLLAVFEEYCEFEAEEWPQRSQSVLVAQQIQRNLEACDKLPHHLSVMRNCVAGLGELRKVRDIPWPEIDWDKIAERIEKRRQALIVRLAEVSIKLPVERSGDDIPDYFGYCHSVLADECYYAMAKDKEEFFKSIFPAYLTGALSAFARLREDLKDQPPETQMVFSTEPIITLFEISGFACIYSELDQKEFWAITKATWDAYFSAHDKPDELLDFLVSMVSARAATFGISPGDLKRTTWRQDFSNRIRPKGIFGNPYGPYESREERETLRHPSAIVRAFTESDFLHYNGSDVFVVVYLLTRAAGRDMGLGAKIESLVETLKREQSRESGHEE